MKLQLTAKTTRRTNLVDENHYQVYSTDTPIVLGKSITTIKRAEGGGRVVGTIQWTMIPINDSILTVNQKIVDFKRGEKSFSLARCVIGYHGLPATFERLNNSKCAILHGIQRPCVQVGKA